MNRRGKILCIQGMSGGVGASTIAVNLANELSALQLNSFSSICLVDLDIQNGAISSYLGLRKRENYFEIQNDEAGVEVDAFLSTLENVEGNLFVLTAPLSLVPVEFFSVSKIDDLISALRSNFEYSIIDLPKYICEWSEALISVADTLLLLTDTSSRSAENTERLIRVLDLGDSTPGKTRLVVNRLNRPFGRKGRSRIKLIEEALLKAQTVWLPWGGDIVARSNNVGVALRRLSPFNRLRRKIRTLAKLLSSSQPINLPR